jgi:hypothetical protein
MRYLDSQVLICSIGFSVVVHVANHGSCNRYTEDVVGVGEKPDSSDKTCASMEPLSVSETIE